MQHEMEKLQKDTCDDLCIWKEIFHLLHSSLTTSTMAFTHQPLVHRSAIASAEFPSQQISKDASLMRSITLNLRTHKTKKILIKLGIIFTKTVCNTLEVLGFYGV